MNEYNVVLCIDTSSVGYQYSITVESETIEEAKRIAVKTLLARLEISQFIKVPVEISATQTEDRWLNCDKVELIWVLDARQI